MWEFKDFKSNRQDVYDAFRQSKDIRIRERCYSVLLAYDGLSPSQIAAILCRDLTTVRQWLQLFNEGGLESLRRPILRRSKTATRSFATGGHINGVPEVT